MKRLPRLAVIALCGVAATTQPAAAHQGGALYIQVRTDKAHEVVLAISARPVDFAPAIGGLRGASPSLYRLRADEVTRFSARYLVVDSARGKLCALKSRALTAAVRGKLTVTLRYLCPRGALRLRSDLFFDDDPDLRVYVTLQLGAGPPKLMLLSRDKRQLSFEPPASRFGAALEFLRLGVEHIFGGYDHVLFLVALLLAAPLSTSQDPRAGRTPRGAFVYMLKIVTAFTISHSITLILAATGSVTLPARLVEPAIALSIIAVGVANVLRARRANATADAAPDARRRLALVFAFGLVHGFGFAGVLAETGLPTQGAALALLSFNVGVELGQLCAIAALFPIIFRLSREPLTLSASLLVMVLLGLFFGALALIGIRVHLWPAFCAALLLAALLSLRRYRYEAVVLRGGSLIVIAFGLLWLVERLAGLRLLGGILG